MELDFEVNRYQSCNPLEYDSNIAIYCAHLFHIHHIPKIVLEDLARGLDQGTWLLVDNLHSLVIDFT